MNADNVYYRCYFFLPPPPVPDTRCVFRASYFLQPRPFNRPCSSLLLNTSIPRVELARASSSHSTTPRDERRGALLKN